MSQSPPIQLNRWIRTSVVKHFRTTLRAALDYESKTTVFIEGQSRNTDDLKHWAELRFDGPYIQKKTLNLYRIRIEVNILLMNTLDSNVSIYHIDDLCGIAANRFTNCLQVFRYGDPLKDAANDSTLVGTLELRRQSNEEVDCSYFGKVVRPDTALEQSTVEGHYEGFWQL